MFSHHDLCITMETCLNELERGGEFLQTASLQTALLGYRPITRVTDPSLLTGTGEILKFTTWLVKLTTLPLRIICHSCLVLTNIPQLPAFSGLYNWCPMTVPMTDPIGCGSCSHH